MTRQEVQNRELTRGLFRRAFLEKDQPQLLALFLARLGYFATDPQAVNPDLLAFANWILAQCGILHEIEGTALAQIHAFAAAVARAASDTDLASLRAAAKEET